jgi:hypothetical protein
MTAVLVAAAGVVVIGRAAAVAAQSNVRLIEKRCLLDMTQMAMVF